MPTQSLSFPSGAFQKRLIDALQPHLAQFRSENNEGQAILKAQDAIQNSTGARVSLHTLGRWYALAREHKRLTARKIVLSTDEP